MSEPANGEPPITSGTLLSDRYRLQRRIAVGGMATVWLGRDEELEREVAVKVLSEVLSEDPSYLLRFRREARLAGGLTHPSLVKIFDFSPRTTRPYLVMEYVDGGTLADRIRDGCLNEVDPLKLARQLLGALNSIHSAGVLHRDVKASNVLIDRDGRARLTDFGIARGEHATRITQTGEVLGTLKYMAPEVREGEPATERSDLYSCGVLLDECVADDSAPEVVALVDRLRQADPAERPGSARAAMAMLDAERPVSLPTAPIAAPTSKARPWREVEISGSRVMAALAALALVATLAALAIRGGNSGEPSKGAKGSARTTATTTTTSVTTTSVVGPPAPTLRGVERAHSKPNPSKDKKLPPGLAKKEGGVKKGDGH